MSGRGGALLHRRSVLAAAFAAAPMLTACRPPREIPGSFAGASAERGHLLREAPRRAAAPVRTRRTQVLVAGGGIAGLAAARALRLRGIEDIAVLDLEDVPGGNSRGARVGGLACPMGAHYLPVPGDDAREVQDFLEELGLRRRVAGRWTYDERQLAHSPQERLFFKGRWQEGLLPVEGVTPATLAQYRRFAREVEAARKAHRFAIPMALRRDAHTARELDAVLFSDWLQARGLDDAQLRWFLDYCCRDDYGAGVATVSAWAGIHYFAARHGFHLPGEQESEREGIFTWPEGNGHLARALAVPLGARFQPARLVARIEETRGGVEIDALDVAGGHVERWQAAHCIVALPVFIAAQVVANPPDFLRGKAARMRYAPWIVANLHLSALPDDRPGPEIAWDNVMHGSKALGYVIATHQKLDPRPGPTVLSWYCAPGEAARAEVLRQPWRHWRDEALADLQPAHPDLRGKLLEVQVARYGHAMSIPVPGTLASSPPPQASRRLSFAHADWAGYSIFEEAFTLGHAAGKAAHWS